MNNLAQPHTETERDYDKRCTLTCTYIKHTQRFVFPINSWLFLCMQTDSTKPTAEKQDISEEAPELKNGKEIPVIGKTIRAAPMLINI